MKNNKKLEITLPLVQELIKVQFSQYSNLSIIQVEPGGHDNRTFRLG